jgi:signal transduction histidine kinase/ligand-binding sensor domain-containing protein
MNLVTLIVLLQLALNPLSLFKMDSSDIRINFSHIDTTNGLSQNAVNAIIQDRHGFLWFGTQDGLNRYDGHSFRYYYHDPFNEASLSNNYIYELLEAQNGDIWVATLRGLNRISAETGIVERVTIDRLAELSEQFVLEIFEDSTGRIWATLNKDIYYKEKNQNTFIRYDLPSDFYSNAHPFNMANFTELRDGRLLIGSWVRHIYAVDIHSLEAEKLLLPGESLKKGNLKITELFEDSNSILWIATWDRGLFRMNLNTGELITHEKLSDRGEETAFSRINKLAEAADGTIYMASRNRGLIIYQPFADRFTLLRHERDNPFSLAGNDAVDVMIDTTGTLWVTTAGMGVSYYSPLITFFERITDLDGSFIYAFERGRDKSLYVGGYLTGLIHLDENNKVIGRYHHGQSQAHVETISILSIFRDSRDRVWIGTTQRGVFLLDENTMTLQQKATMGEVKSIIEDRDGNVWLVSDKDGLFILKNTAREFVSVDFDMSRARFYIPSMLLDLKQDRNGVYWLASSGGLYTFEKMQKEYVVTKRYAHDHKNTNSLISDLIVVLLETRDGSMYVGTRGGLSVISKDRDTITNYSTIHGLPNNVIYGIIEDDAGFVWLSTNRGLSRFNPVSKEFENYFLSSGLQDMEFNTHAVYRREDGHLYFGGVNGVNHIKPQRRMQNLFKPNVSFSSFDVGGQVAGSDAYINSNPTITLDYKNSSIAFTMAINDLSDSSLNRYAYKIDGIDQEWTIVRSSASPNYHRLTKGEYTVRIRGANSQGVWSTNDRHIHLIVKPPFYESDLFAYIVAGSLLIIVTAIFFWRARIFEQQRIKLETELEKRTKDIKNYTVQLESQTRQLQQQQEELQEANHELESFSYTVSHDLQAPINTIKGFVDLIKEDVGEEKEREVADFFGRIYNNLSHMEELIQNLLKFSRSGRREVKRQRCDLSFLVRQVANDIQNSYPEKEYTVLVQNSLVAHADEFLITIVIQNLLHNAFKYSQNEENPKIEFGQNHESEAFFIRDNGVGFSTNDMDKLFIPFERLHAQAEFKGSGIGLATVKRIIDRHDGSIWAESEVDAGATFWFTIPDMQDSDE